MLLHMLVQAKVDDQYTFSTDELHGAEIVALGDNRYHLVVGGRSLPAEVVDYDLRAKTFTVRINGRRYTVRLATELDTLIERLGLGKRSSSGGGHVKAPMPGLVREVQVVEGQTLAAGDSVLILEAMKMENVIKASVGGTVRRVAVGNGTAVEKNQVLVEITPAE